MVCKLIKSRIFVFSGSILLISVIINFYFSSIGYNDAYANGFTKSSMVCSGFESFRATLCIGIKPVVLKGATTDNFAIRLELYDESSNNSVFPNATFVMAITKNEYDSKFKDEPFLSGIFNTRNGRFTINVNNSETELIQTGNRFSIGLNSTLRSDSANLSLPKELHSGQYRFQIMAYVKNSEPLYFDSDIQVGDIESKDVALNKTVNNLTIVSYYDKINDFVYDSNERTITWHMPFEYNITKIDNQKVSVHQEIIIPDSFLNLTHIDNFNMTMNDNYFDSSYFYVDPYSLRNKTIIHYVPDANTLFHVSYNNSRVHNHIMKFVLFL